MWTRARRDDHVRHYGGAGSFPKLSACKTMWAVEWYQQTSLDALSSRRERHCYQAGALSGSNQMATAGGGGKEASTKLDTCYLQPRSVALMYRLVWKTSMECHPYRW